MGNTYITRTNKERQLITISTNIFLVKKDVERCRKESVFELKHVDDNNRFKFRLRSDDKFDFELGVGGSWYSLISNRKLRDRTGWMHIAYDNDSPSNEL